MKYRIPPLLIAFSMMMSCSEIDALKQGLTVQKYIYKSEYVMIHPSAVDTKDGRSLIVFESQNQTTTNPSQILSIHEISTGGWSKPDTLSCSVWSCKSPAITCLKDGLLYLVMTQKQDNENKGCYVILSYDNGVHFSAPRKIRIDHMKAVQTHAPVVETENGTLIWPLEGIDTTGTRTAFVLRSVDRGETWQSPVPVSRGGKNNFLPQIAALSGDRVICILNADSSGYIRTVSSHDGGLSWHAPQDTPMYGKNPWILCSDRGSLITVFMDQWPEGVSTCTSYNFGKSWEKEKQVIPLPENKVYQFSCHMENKEIKVHYIHSGDKMNAISELRIPVTEAKPVKGLSARRQKNHVIVLRWNADADADYYIIYKKTGTVQTGSEFSIEDRYEMVAENHFKDFVNDQSTYSYVVSTVTGQGPAIYNTGMESSLCNPAVVQPLISDE